MTRRPPFVVMAVVVLGIASMVGGISVAFRPCDDCINETIGGVLAGWGLLAFLSIVPRMVGLVCLLSALGGALFLGLVFAFAGQWQGLIPPILLVALTVLEQDDVRALYARDRAPAATETGS